MVKCLAVLTTSLAALVFVASCPSPKTASTEPESVQAEPNQVEPDKSESPCTDPNDNAPAPVEPSQEKTEPNKVEPSRTDPNEVTPAVPEPNQAKPNDAAPVVSEPNQVEPNDVDPNNLPPIKVEPNDVDPNDVPPTKVEPNDVDSNDVKQVTVEPNDPNTKPTVSFHDKCADVLKTFVDKQGMVDYKNLRRKRPELRTLLSEFDNLDPKVYNSWPKNDKIAFWINAYNIQMLKIITYNYPIEGSRFLYPLPGWGPKSIRHIKGIWTRHKFLVMDEEFTLNEIDERFFQKEFDEPRVLFALTRASLSGPQLRNEPYYGYKLDEQLNDQAKKFLANPKAFRIDRKKGMVYLSALFQKTVYGKNFISKYGIDRKFKKQEPSTRAVLNFITNYISEEDKSFLEVGNYTVQYIRYDWTINDGS